MTGAHPQVQTIIFRHRARPCPRGCFSRHAIPRARHFPSPQEIWTAIEKDPRFQDWQEGRISPRDWHLHLAKRLGGSLSFEQFTEAWNRALDPQPIQDNSLFEALRKNFSHRPLIQHRSDSRRPSRSDLRFFPILSEIDPHLLLRGWRQQTLAAHFRDALKSLRAKAESSVFIDDIEAYVNAARSLGLHGIHYQSPASSGGT